MVVKGHQGGLSRAIKGANDSIWGLSIQGGSLDSLLEQSRAALEVSKGGPVSCGGGASRGIITMGIIKGWPDDSPLACPARLHARPNPSHALHPVASDTIGHSAHWVSYALAPCIFSTHYWARRLLHCPLQALYPPLGTSAYRDYAMVHL